MSDNKINEKTNIEELLKIIVNNKLNEFYPSYQLVISSYGYCLQLKNETNNFNSIFIFHEKIKINLISNNNIIKTFSSFSNIEFKTYIIKKKIEITELFLKDIQEEFSRYIDNTDCLGLYIKNKELNIYLKNKAQLPLIKKKFPLIRNINYSPEEYSEYFYEYFIYENKQKYLDFIFNETREIIIFNLVKLRKNNELKKFKFTGPTSIGKSLTLFYACKTNFNYIYINLRTLKKNINDLYKCYCIIISELQNLLLEDDILDKLNKYIQNCYDKQLTPIKCILSIMEFLNNLKNNYFIFAFDQYKDHYLTNNFFEQINNYQYIKYILCSSINDKKIRDYCLNSWKLNINNISLYNKDTQEYFFYFADIYTYKQDKYNNDKLLKQFNFLTKYIKIYENNNKNEESFLKEIKEKINNKIIEFCEKKKYEYFDLLIHIRYIMNKQYNFNQLSEVIPYCLLKYFTIHFNKEGFLVKPIFPYMNNFIRVQLTEEICENYFKYKTYRKNTIENDSVKGCYFEAAVKFGLQKLKLPFNNYKIITLKEISTMDEIIDLNSYYDYDNEGEIQESKNEINNDNNKKENEYIDFDTFLKKFEIEKTDKKNEDENKVFIKKYIPYLSNTTYYLSRKIDFYMENELEIQKDKIKNLIKNNDFNGDESLILDQIKKQGKALDYGFLYGKRLEKIFVGIQIKCYFENSDLNEEAINKSKIKIKCQKILFNSMKLFNCKITKWYYLLIFFINKEKLEENISGNNLYKCILNDIPYLFYNPVNKIFYDKNKKEIKSLDFNNMPDLDFCETSIINYVLDNNIFLKNKRKVNISNDLEKMMNSFIVDLSWLCDKDKSFENILDKITEIIRCKVVFDAKIGIFEDYIFLPPDERHAFIYKIGKDFILIENIDNIITFLEMKTNKKLTVNEFYKSFEKNKGYFYCLEKIIKYKWVKI